ncbi:restriction endonuclease [Paracoccus laeviglucosivorans]|uniref:Endonuclease, HJR/Mrr/RecB family n=1 Tax=Paracoccus laeviglucosivorans TaxID=1197861 RepID=A0A521EVZ2_9RHOB|nr:restriction endonuclease [Paracoccus laeviglucosivorans]SMO88087.1 Endonuclease, HJR/Mrr/RecB family [Paracoccus laeviglucosivorans]
MLDERPWILYFPILIGLGYAVLGPTGALIGLAAGMVIHSRTERARSERTERYRVERERLDLRELLIATLRKRLADVEEKVVRTYFVTVTYSHMDVENEDRFHKEIVEFLESGLTPFERKILAEERMTLKQFYHQHLASALLKTCRQQANTSPASFAVCSVETRSNQSRGIAFETWCQQQLQAAGWSVSPTSKSGDQGVDLVITRHGQTGVVQCKLHEKPVGNDAVQQVSAGRPHYRAHFAIVVAKSGYTRSARTLAESNGVELLHPNQLSRYRRSIS